jgi:hypothetical protein
MRLILALVLMMVCSPVWATNYCEDAAVVACWPMEEDDEDPKLEETLPV